MSLEKRRIIEYILTAVVLLVIYIILKDSPWRGGVELHTLMEVIATTLALSIGIIALIRHYTKRSSMLLLIGAGFLGTAFLDGYHTVVTSSFFSTLLVSVPESLIPWSWLASRLFLSIVLFASWYVCFRESKAGSYKIKDYYVYLIIGIATILSFIFFSFVSLPRAYHPELFFGRPEELIPAVFFFMALVGYFLKGHWKRDVFEHWLVLSLIVGFIGQAVFMSFSTSLFDFQFDAAHLLKKVSYIFTLVGLLISMFYLFKQAESGKDKLEKQNVALERAKKEAENSRKLSEESKKKLEVVLDEAQESKSTLERLNKMMVGRELQMIKLKKEISDMKDK